MMRYFLGVDIGNTKSHALIADENGRAVGFGAAGVGSWEAIGEAGFSAILHEIVHHALKDAGLKAHDITGAGFGLAGYDWESDRPIMERAIRALGLRCPFEYVNDALLGLYGGTRDGWGVVVSAGTGENCRGRDPQGREGRVTGNGWLFAEYGGGHTLADEGMRAVARAWSRRGEPTLLTEMFLRHTGASSVDGLMEGLARGRYHVRAADAPLVFEAARAGDTAAINAIRIIGVGLADLAVGVIRQLEFEDIAFEVVLSGSLYGGSPLIQQEMERIIRAVAPRAVLTRFDAPPVVGGVILGMRCAGTAADDLRETLSASCRAIIAKR